MLDLLARKGPLARIAFELGEAEFDFSNWNVCHGGKGGGSGGGTSTVTQVANPPPQVLAAYQTAQNAAQTAASAPLQTYGGPYIAGFTPDQLQAFQTVAGTQGAAQPYLQSANQAIQNSQTPLWNSVPQFNAQNVGQYESPYTKDVVQATENQLNNQNAIQQNQVVGNAISQGAWGGDRSAVAQAQLAGQQALAEAPTIAGLENTGYSTALGEFNTQQQAQLGANEANSYLNSQAGFGYGNLGTLATSLPLEQANAQSAAGAQQQNLGQQALNIPYEQFLQAQAYPFQTAQYYSNIAEGLGPGQGSSGTSTSTSPGASTASQIGGGLLGTAGLLGATGAFGAGGWLTGAGAAAGGEGIDYAAMMLGGLAKGGRIKRDSGGGIPDYSVSIVPYQSNGAGTRPLPLPAPPKTDTTSQGSSSSPSDKNVMAGLSGLGKLINSGLNSGRGSIDSNPLDTSSSALDIGGETNPMDIFSSGGFKAGGGVPQYRAKYGGGGNVLTDIVSGIGDIAGAFFGDPMAGDQVTGLTGHPGIESQLMSRLHDGGRAHRDVGGQTPLSAENASQQMPTQGSYLNNMTPEQLQNYILRLPPGSSQSQAAAKVLQQKRTMPNVGTQAQGGLGTQVAAPQAPSLAQPGMSAASVPQQANGGRLSRDEGGDIPPPPTPDEIDLQQEVAAEPQAGMGSISSAPVPQQQEKPETKSQSKVDPWEALATAGFGIMGGTSPQAGVNIGRGALMGIQNYEGQKKQVAQENYQTGELGMRGRGLDLEAQKMADQVDQWHAVNERENKQQEFEKTKFSTLSADQKAQIGLKEHEWNNLSAYQQAEVQNQIAERQKPIPDGMGGFIIPNLQDPTKPQHIAGVGMGSTAIDPSTGQPVTGEAYLKTIDPVRARELKAMDEGDLNFPTSFALKTPYWQQFLAQLYQYNPEASQQTAGAYKQFMSGPLGNTTRSLNVATQHINLVNGLVDALDNGDTKAVNSIGNMIKTQFGLSSAPTTVDAAKQLLANELVKATTGSGGALGDRETIENNLNKANSPKLLKDTLQTYFGMMGGQFHGLNQQYESQTRRHDFAKFLSPEAKQALSAAEAHFNPSNDNAAGSAQPAIAIPDPSQRVPNQVYQTPRGAMTWTGTGWLPAQVAQ